MKPTQKEDRTKYFQIRWENRTKEHFRRLCEDYDIHLSINGGIQKLVECAIQNHWLPGYTPKGPGGREILTGIETELLKLKSGRKTIDTSQD